MRVTNDGIAARVFRGSSVEALHAASVAVVNERGELTHSFGDPSRSFSLRSSTKPFQALPLVTSGAAERVRVSTNASLPSRARRTAEAMGTSSSFGACSTRAGAGPEALRCGTHLPIGMRLRHELPLHGEDRDPLRHNCSGKHAGFLLVSRRLGEPFDAYLAPGGAVQSLVRDAVAEALELSPAALETAIDGCSAPTFATPLVALARGMKNLALANAAAPGSCRRASPRAGRDARRAVLVSGEGRFDYDLARSFPGNVVNKSGAEAILGIGFRDPPLGIAIKIHDGAERALAPVAVAVLRELGLVADVASVPLLARYERPVHHEPREAHDRRARR